MTSRNLRRLLMLSSVTAFSKTEVALVTKGSEEMTEQDPKNPILVGQPEVHDIPEGVSAAYWEARDREDAADLGVEKPHPIYTIGDLLEREAAHKHGEAYMANPPTIHQLVTESRVRLSVAVMYAMPLWVWAGGPGAGHEIPNEDAALIMTNLAAGLQPLLESVVLGVHPQCDFSKLSRPARRVYAEKIAPYQLLSVVKGIKIESRTEPQKILDKVKLLRIYDEYPQLAQIINDFGYSYSTSQFPTVDSYIFAAALIMEAVGLPVEGLANTYMEATAVYVA